MNEMLLGQKIKKQREKLGYSQTVLAKLIGIDQGMMSRIELGKRRIHPVKELPLLSKYLEVPYSWFLEERVLREEITLESIIKRKFPSLELTDEEVARLSGITETFLEGLINADPTLNQKIRRVND